MCAVARRPPSRRGARSWRSRAAVTRRALGLPRTRVGSCARRSASGRWTWTRRSMRSSSGPLSRRAWRARSPSRAAAAPRRRVAARARVRGGDEHEARREDRRALAAHDRHAAVLQRLAQRLERRARELGQLVEEQHAVVGEARLARRRDRAAADQAGGGDHGGAARGTGRSAISPPPRRSPATLWMRVTSTASARESGGRIEGSRRASIVLPTPGGPESSRLCAAGGSDGQRLDDVGVAADVGEVEVARRGGASARSSPVGRRRALAAAQDLGHLREAAGPEHVEPVDERGLERPLRAGRRGPSSPARAAALRHGERAAARAHLAPERRARRRPRSARARRAGCWPPTARIAQAMARSKPGPALRIDAGARLTVTRLSGNSKPELRIAARTRSRASRTARSARPTIVKFGQAGAHVDLDRDAPRVESVDGEGGDAGEHGGHARRRPCDG